MNNTDYAQVTRAARELQPTDLASSVICLRQNGDLFVSTHGDAEHVADMLEKWVSYIERCIKESEVKQ